MASSQSFVSHVLDLLSLLGPVQARRMFGGHGLYLRGVMFALLDDDELFLKTDAETRPRFEEAACAMWTFPGASETGYFRPPDDAHEDAEAMLPWGRLGLEAALRKHAEKVARERAAAERRAAREAKASPALAPRRTGKARASPAKAAAARKAKAPAAPRAPRGLAGKKRRGAAARGSGPPRRKSR